MSSGVNIKKIDINEQNILEKVTNDNLGLQAAKEWKDLIEPYTPRDTGQLEDKAVIAPWTITYNPVSKNGYHYARKIYYGVNLNFQTTHNPYATHQWDKAAEQAGKKQELCNRLNAYLKSK